MITTAADTLLTVHDLSIQFGGLKALSHVQLDVAAGSIHSLIGPNGAGKTTLFNCITRVYQPNAGDIRYRGIDLLATPAHKLAHLGIARTFQNLELFPHMTVLGNALTGAHHFMETSVLTDAVWVGRTRNEERKAKHKVLSILDFLGLSRYKDTAVKDLPFGIQKMVELARALVMAPRLLLLDEPTAGLNTGEIEALKGLVKRVRSELQVTVLVIAHDMGFVMDLSDRVTVLNFGTVIAEGPPAAVQQDPQVLEAYLGQVDDNAES